MKTSWFAWLAALISPTLASASSQELRDKLQTLAQDVLTVTKKQAVTVGVFSPTGLPDTNSGPGLEGELTNALNRISPGVVKDHAPFEIKGDYGHSKSTDPSKAAIKVIRISTRIIEKETGKKLIDADHEIELDGTRTIAQVLQISASLPPDGTKEERNKKLDEARTKPTTHVQGSLVSSSPTAPYQIEFGAGSPPTETQGLSSRTARLEKGKAFVDLAEGEVYDLKIHNKDAKPIAVAITIDGLDMYHFTKDRDPANGRPLYTHTLVPPGTTATILGWHHQVQGAPNYHRFQVKKYGEGLSSKEGIARGKVGVVHVAVSYCEFLAPGSRAAPGLETGMGPPVTVVQEPVRLEIRPPHDFVAIRYAR